jgi:hypothetical protein
MCIMQQPQSLLFVLGEVVLERTLRPLRISSCRADTRLPVRLGFLGGEGSRGGERYPYLKVAVLERPLSGAVWV